MLVMEIKMGGLVSITHIVSIAELESLNLIRKFIFYLDS